MRILFVCTGNTCRSSMAEGLARKWLELNAPYLRDISVESAGLAAYPELPASHQAIEAMAELDINIANHAARQVTRHMADNSDIILAMTENHKKALVSHYPDASSKIYTLGEYGGQTGTDVSDPFGQPLEVYRKSALQIRELVDIVLHKIIKPAE